jgi:(p)ppGpp synthase/HD superfamily hydrolase
MTNVEKARDFAVCAHGDQKYGDKPYVYHLDHVAEILKPYGETAQVVGYLHDVLEDTAASQIEVELCFGRFVACAVHLVTDRRGESRRERKIKTNAMLSQIEGFPLPLIVKAADRLANLRESAKGGQDSKLAMYRREHDEFHKAVYRPGICEPIWSEIEAIIGEFPCQP